jgi:hypothetical protein
MPTRRWRLLSLARGMFILPAAFFSASGIAQNVERIPYWAPQNWTVTTYRSEDSKEFLRCSAERHYDNGTALTVAKNNAGNIVLGFTSSNWTYEDRSTHDISIRIDSGEQMSFPGRVRVLPSGPIVFVDLEYTNPVVPTLSTGRMLNVSSPETTLEFELTGSASAVASVDQCHLEGTQ